MIGRSPCGLHVFQVGNLAADGTGEHVVLYDLRVYANSGPDPEQRNLGEAEVLDVADFPKQFLPFGRVNLLDRLLIQPANCRVLVSKQGARLAAVVHDPNSFTGLPVPDAGSP